MQGFYSQETQVIIRYTEAGKFVGHCVLFFLDIFNKGWWLRDIHYCDLLVFADKELETFESYNWCFWFLVQRRKIARLYWYGATWWEGDAVFKIGVPGETIDINFLKELGLSDEIVTNKILIQVEDCQFFLGYIDLAFENGNSSSIEYDREAVINKKLKDLPVS